MRTIIKKKSTVSIAVVIFLLLLSNHFVFLRNNVYALCVEGLKMKSIYAVKEYQTYETLHFTIKYLSVDEDMVPIVAETIEQDFESVTKNLHYEAEGKITMIIYPNLETMRDKLNLSSQDKPMGIYYGGILHILSPKVWIKANSREELQQAFISEGPMVHELVHLIVDRKAHGNFPLWFTEGVALYYENKITGYEWRADLKGSTKYYTLNELTHQFHDIDIDIAYRQSFEIIKSIVDQYGENQLLLLLDDLRTGVIGKYSNISLENVINSLIQ